MGEPNFPLRLGVIIHRWRKDKEMKQTELAEATGVDQSYISKLEKGIINDGVNLAKMYRIVSALDKKLSDLFRIAESELPEDIQAAREAAMQVLAQQNA